MLSHDAAMMAGGGVEGQLAAVRGVCGAEDGAVVWA